MTDLLPEQGTAQLTEWEQSDWLLHRVTGDYLQLFDPECRDETPVEWLAEFGVGPDWLAETEQVGEVRVTHLYRPSLLN